MTTAALRAAVEEEVAALNVVLPADESCAVIDVWSDHLVTHWNTGLQVTQGSDFAMTACDMLAQLLCLFCYYTCSLLLGSLFIPAAVLAMFANILEIFGSDVVINTEQHYTESHSGSIM